MLYGLCDALQRLAVPQVVYDTQSYACGHHISPKQL